MFRTRQKHFDENKWEKFRMWPKHFEENQWRKLRTRQIKYDNICTLFRSHGWNIVNFFACEKFELLSDQGCFENVSELFFEVKVEINYDFEVKKFMSWLEIKMFFKMRHNPHLYLLKITKKWKSVSKYTHLWTFKSHHTPPYWCAPLAELSSDESLTMNHGTQYKPAKG